MTNSQLFTAQAIQAAGRGEWAQAIECNEKLIESDPTDIGALNRLAFCLMQKGSSHKAKEIYEKVLAIEKFNPIASKYLSLLKSRIKTAPLSSIVTGDFIEEPGKTKSVPLVKLADPAILQSIPTATQCSLIVKNHRVNVTTKDANTYVGCLPDDIAFRLQKMITSGNQYSVCVQSTSKKSCVVFIKEILKNPSSPFATSFPLSGQSRSTHQEDVMLDETPLDVRETGDEVETPDFEEPETME